MKLAINMQEKKEKLGDLFGFLEEVFRQEILIGNGKTISYY